MKLRNELPNMIEAFETIKRQIPTYVKQVKMVGGYKDLETRISWDLLYITKGSAWICELYDKYNCHDTHITTLAKRALSQVYPMLKEEKINMYVLTYNDFSEEWTLTTRENYERRIQNDRETDYFSKRDGFACTADVINYARNHFNLTLDQITCIDC